RPGGGTTRGPKRVPNAFSRVPVLISVRRQRRLASALARRMNGGKSHALHKGAPGPTALYVSASRKGAASEHAKVALPFDGMQSFKGAACWCKKCAGSKSGQDNHSRMGCSPPSAVYPNCALYKSDVRLSKVQKRARTLAAPDDGGGGPARRCRARREDGQALPTEPADASAPGTNQVRA
ncbi:hypothetical protein M885DRAFT_212540, partial [Pelagophyceae sp. CCMP2097]